jgi:tartrate-resistant acid phosphatase type 5
MQPAARGDVRAMEIESGTDIRVVQAHTWKERVGQAWGSSRCRWGCLGTAGLLVCVVLAGRFLRTGPVPEASRLPLTAALVDGSGRGTMRNLVAIGDWGRAGILPQTETGAALALTVSSLAAGDVVSVGDNFYTNGVTSVDDPLFQQSWSQVYAQPAMAGVPWWLVAGNHDYRGNLTAQMSWGGDPRWRFPALSYTVTWPLAGGNGTVSTAPPDRACVRGVFIDTVPFINRYRTNPESPTMAANLANANATAQWAWIETQLQAAASQCVCTLVFGHHPVFSGAEHGNAPELVQNLLPLLERYPVDAYIAGHDHTLIHLLRGPVHYWVTGAGSQLRTGTQWTPETLWFADVNGFTVHSVNATHIRHSVVAVGGTVAHTVLVPLRAAR